MSVCILINGPPPPQKNVKRQPLSVGIMKLYNFGDIIIIIINKWIKTDNMCNDVYIMYTIRIFII